MTTISLNIEKKWEVSGVSMPESILSIPDHDWLYVSNVNKQETGYISRISKDGVIDDLKWIEGIATPTGMGFLNGKIYVADQSQVHVIELESAKIIKTLSSAAKTLNDISISKDGRVFVSDISTGSIYTVQDDSVVLWTKSAEFPFPNGVLVQNNDLIVGDMGTALSRSLTADQYGSLYKVNLSDKSVQLIKSTNKIGSIDGIVAFNDGLIITTVVGKLFYVTEDKQVLLGSAEGGIADLGIDAEKQMIYVPFLFANKVVAYHLSSEL